MRSVERRLSHRLRIRCELKTLLHTVPLHDPCSEMTTTVAHEPRSEARGADAAPARCRRSGWRRADNPPRHGSGMIVVRRGAQKQAERVARCGSEREAARRHLIDIARTQLSDHGADGAA